MYNLGKIPRRQEGEEEEREEEEEEEEGMLDINRGRFTILRHLVLMMLVGVWFFINNYAHLLGIG